MTTKEIQYNSSVIQADTFMVFQVKDCYTGEYRYVISYSFKDEYLRPTEKLVGSQSLYAQFLGHVDIVL